MSSSNEGAKDPGCKSGVHRLTLYVDGRELRKLKKLLDRDDRSVSWWFRQQVKKYLAERFAR